MMYCIKVKKNVTLVRFINLLLLMLFVLLLSNEPARLVNGQLEAVGAVLSVVPVTSILATAGLVGVKLAALSRLLQALGYDQAYLANAGGHGTAATPIGLQTNYAYMFPYVPGLNISVKSEHGSGYQNMAHQQKDAYSTTRKTYPAMGLPGDYEIQNKPFRGSETLREIFRSSGINIKFPSQQQIQQQFNGYPKGNRQEQNPITDPSNKNINFQPIATTPIYNSNYLINHNEHLQHLQQPQHPPPPTPPPIQSNNENLNYVPPSSPHPSIGVPIAVTIDNSNHDFDTNLRPAHKQGINQPSSSRFQPPDQQGQPQQQQQQQQQQQTQTRPQQELHLPQVHAIPSGQSLQNSQQ